MKEIGGYFELEKSTGKEYYDYLAFNSARNALQFIIRKRNINKIYLPYYLCLVIEETLKKENVEINYYHVDDSFLPIIENYDNESYVYITNYFGLLTKDIILKLKEKYKIILDNVQAFFLEGFEDIDTIYTCRKFFGIVDGAYLYTNLECNENYEIATSLNKLNYLFGRYEENASKYYDEYVQSEKSLIDQNIKFMSKITHNMLRSIDYNNIKCIRRQNYNYLAQKLNSRNLLNLRNKDGLFMYPLLKFTFQHFGQELKNFH